MEDNGFTPSQEKREEIYKGKSSKSISKGKNSNMYNNTFFV